MVTRLVLFIILARPLKSGNALRLQTTAPLPNLRLVQLFKIGRVTLLFALVFRGKNLLCIIRLLTLATVVIKAGLEVLGIVGLTVLTPRLSIFADVRLCIALFDTGGVVVDPGCLGGLGSDGRLAALRIHLVHVEIWLLLLSCDRAHVRLQTVLVLGEVRRLSWTIHRLLISLASTTRQPMISKGARSGGMSVS